jgi:hypothetical protein
MKITKLKKSTTSQKTSPKKEPLKTPPLLKKIQAKPSVKKTVSPVLAEANERTEWRKEKREYWSGRFRKILAEIALKPKIKKSSFF